MVWLYWRWLFFFFFIYFFFVLVVLLFFMYTSGIFYENTVAISRVKWISCALTVFALPYFMARMKISKPKTPFRITHKVDVIHTTVRALRCFQLLIAHIYYVNMTPHFIINNRLCHLWIESFLDELTMAIIALPPALSLSSRKKYCLS